MFEPIEITDKTTAEKLEIKAIRLAYEKVCSNLFGMKVQLEHILYDFEQDVSLELMLELIKSDPEIFAKRKFVEERQISVPGLSNESLIKSNLLDIPKEPYQNLLEEHKMFLHEYAKAKKMFDFGIEKFYYTFEGYGMFNLNDVFEIELENIYKTRTTTEKQNEAVKAIQRFTDALNDLVELGVLSGDARWSTQIVTKSLLSMDRTEKRPFKVSRNCLRHINPLGKQEKIEFVPDMEMLKRIVKGMYIPVELGLKADDMVSQADMLECLRETVPELKEKQLYNMMVELCFTYKVIEGHIYWEVKNL